MFIQRTRHCALQSIAPQDSTPVLRQEHGSREICPFVPFWILYLDLNSCFTFRYRHRYCQVCKGYCLAMLAKYPTAKRLAAAKLDSILDIPYMYPELAKKLHNAAKSSTAHAIDEVQEELVKAKLKEIFAGKQQSLTLLKTKRGAWDSLPDGPHQRIHSIKGIGLQRRLRW